MGWLGWGEGRAQAEALSLGEKAGARGMVFGSHYKSQDVRYKDSLAPLALSNISTGRTSFSWSKQPGQQALLTLPRDPGTAARGVHAPKAQRQESFPNSPNYASVSYLLGHNSACFTMGGENWGFQTQPGVSATEGARQLGLGS